MTFALGLNPSPPDAIRFKLSDFSNLMALPPAPPVFGHNLNMAWGMLGNLDVGDCVVAGGMHEHMLWTREWAAKPAPFDAATAIRQYSELSGYVPGDESTDAGLDMASTASYRRRVGLIDTLGIRHKVDAYMQMSLVIPDLIQAAYILGAVGLGVRIPKSATQQFDQERPWTIVRGSKLLGGHYVPLVGRNSHGNPLIVTWGRLQAVTVDWLMKYLDEAVAYVSIEHIGSQGFTREGFNLDKLRQALTQLA